MVPVLRFGIPSLDALWDGPEEAVTGIRIDEYGEATSLCIMGTDGSGKTVLGLHLASRYMADCQAKGGGSLPYVIYAASDLSFGTAEKMWRNFDLYHPNSDQVCPCHWCDWMDPSLGYGKLRVDLEHCIPLGSDEREASPAPEPRRRKALTSLLASNSRLATVRFLDLACYSAGDDWAYLTRLLAALDAPANEQPRHLLILDSVEGLEALTGQWDAHGEPRDRRSRLAQLLRAATGKCHVALLLEEMEAGRRTPEQFVTDCVIHLGVHEIGDYLQRYVEIEKARGTSFIRGRHPYLIRDGQGSKSAGVPNPDNRPRYLVDDAHQLVAESARERFRTHLHVHQTLHGYDPDRTKAGGSAPPQITFGMQYLDDLLSAPQSDVSKSTKPSRGSLTAVIGDQGTYKSSLGRAFLAQAAGRRGGVAVLITTALVTHQEVCENLADHLKLDRLPKGAAQRVMVRHLGTHHFSAETLLHLFREMIAAAIGAATGSKGRFDVLRNRCELVDKAAGRVRLLVDDLSSILANYPAVAREPMFLTCLHQLFMEHRVSAVITDSQPGNPNPLSREDRSRVLRGLADRVIYTWPVSFYGQSRVAVTVVPPVSGGHAAAIRELRRAEPSRDRLWVDPHFEVYVGLDRPEPEPEPIGIDIHLFAESEAENRYHTELRSWIEQAIPSKTPAQLLLGTGADQYDGLRGLANALPALRSDRSSVVQVDEFWRPGEAQVLDLGGYLTPNVIEGDQDSLDAEDPFGLWRPSPSVDRLAQFTEEQREALDAQIRDGQPVLRLPYTWDLGLLMCRWEAWEHAGPELFTPGGALASGRMPVATLAEQLATTEIVTWRAFLRACQVVAAKQRTGQACAFDVSMTAPETYSCLVMEVWASEIALTMASAADAPQAVTKGLPYCLRQHHHELFRAMLLLGEVFDGEAFGTNGLVFGSHGMRPGAIAARHWFSSACAMPKPSRLDDLYVVRALPGQFSVRGDWSLVVPTSTRSARLSLRGLDILLSRRGNAERLQHGIGLPVREVSPAAESGGGEGAWVPLYQVAADTKAPTAISYNDIRDISGRYRAGADGPSRHWIRRSEVTGYAAHQRAWTKWLCRRQESWRRYIREAVAATERRTAFAVYDELCDGKTGGVADILLNTFKDDCNWLADVLEGATARPIA